MDLCLSLGLAMTIEDTWGGDIATAAILHLASTVPAKAHFSSTDFNAYNTVATGTIDASSGRCQGGAGMRPPTGSRGLGVMPNWKALGDPVATYE